MQNWQKMMKEVKNLNSFDPRRTILKISKYLIVFTLIAVLTFTFMAQKPAPLIGEPLILGSTIAIGLIVLLCAIGVYAASENDWNACAGDMWNKMTDELRLDVINSIDLVNRKFEVSDTLYAWARQYVTDTYVIGQSFHFLESSYISSPWGDQYVKTPWLGEITSPWVSVTAEQYATMTLYSQITWGDYTMKYVYDGLYEVLKINDLSYSSFPHDNYRYYDIKYYDNSRQCDVYLTYGGTMFWVGYYNTYRPAYAFLYNSSLEKLYFVLVRQDNGGAFKAHTLRILENNTMVDYDTLLADGSYATAVVDGAITTDQDFDWKEEGVRELDLPYEVAQVLGLDSADALAQQWADITDVYRQWAELGSVSVTIDNLELPQTGVFDWSGLQMPILEIPDRFPFCIPFDLYNAIDNLSASAVEPEFNITTPDTEYFGGEQVFNFDFGIFDTLRSVVKWIALFGFVIALIVRTRKLIRG